MKQKNSWKSSIMCLLARSLLSTTTKRNLKANRTQRRYFWNLRIWRRSGKKNKWNNRISQWPGTSWWCCLKGTRTWIKGFRNRELWKRSILKVGKSSWRQTRRWRKSFLMKIDMIEFNQYLHNKITVVLKFLLCSEWGYLWRWARYLPSPPSFPHHSSSAW